MKILVISFVELSDSIKEEIRKEFRLEDVELDFTISFAERPGWKMVYVVADESELIKRQIQNLLWFQSLRSVF